MTDFESEIREKGYIVYYNEGDSMMPLLRQHKDIIIIKKITEPLKKYDVVLYKRPNGAYILHRIIKICAPGQYLISGDNRSFTETVPEDWIFGILSEIIKDGRHIPVESDEYKTYLKTLPMRRFKRNLTDYVKAVRSKFKA